MIMTNEDWNRLHPQSRTKCGGCKATGVELVWNDKAELVPAEPRRPCPICHGTGWFPSNPDPESN